MPRKKTCSCYGCDNPPALGGLCEQHSKEVNKKNRRYMEATSFLHTGVIDGEYITEGPLRSEYHRLQVWWIDICNAQKFGNEHPVLKDETRWGTDWCINIAQQIIEGERDKRAGREPLEHDVREYLKQETWKRFENLQKGLMSNGVERPVKR